jgi:hypothetical protein
MINQGAVTKVVRDGMLDITTGKRLGKKKTITENLSNVKKPKTRWQKIMDWLNTPIGGQLLAQYYWPVGGNYEQDSTKTIF